LLCKAFTDWFTCSYRLLALRLMAVATILSNLTPMAVDGWGKYFPRWRGAWTSIIYFNWLWKNIKYVPYCYTWGRALSRGFFGCRVKIRVYQIIKEHNFKKHPIKKKSMHASKFIIRLGNEDYV
jgi:hypothetical protein